MIGQDDQAGVLFLETGRSVSGVILGCFLFLGSRTVKSTGTALALTPSPTPPVSTHPLGRVFRRVCKPGG